MKRTSWIINILRFSSNDDNHKVFEEAKEASLFITEMFGHQVQQYPNSMTKYTTHLLRILDSKKPAASNLEFQAFERFIGT